MIQLPFDGTLLPAIQKLESSGKCSEDKQWNFALYRVKLGKERTNSIYRSSTKAIISVAPSWYGDWCRDHHFVQYSS